MENSPEFSGVPIQAEQPQQSEQTEEEIMRSPLARGPLSATDAWRLTLYKWRFSLESAGFTTEQARRLLFLKWLYGNDPNTHG